jgi:hypothetical protein
VTLAVPTVGHEPGRSGRSTKAVQELRDRSGLGRRRPRSSGAPGNGAGVALRQGLAGVVPDDLLIAACTTTPPAAGAAQPPQP